MLSNRKVIFCLLGMLIFVSSIAFVQKKDVEGSKDHPLISRFHGSIIKYYDVKQFDEYILVLAKVKWERDEDYKRVFNFDRSKQLEGKVTRIQYDAPEDRSTLEIYRNYESALKRAGFEILFAGAREELGEDFGEAAYYAMRNVRGDYWYYLCGHVEHQRYIAAKLSRPEGDVETLVSRYGIDPDRLHPIGVGPSAPADSNETEEGRARNRRVELVRAILILRDQ